MEDRTKDDSPDSVYDAVEAVDELTAALMEIPEAYAVFMHLSPQEQVGLVEWIDNAANPRNRERRLKMIAAVLARSESERVSLADTVWLEQQASVDPE